jgi:carbonic anhydrase
MRTQTKDIQDNLSPQDAHRILVEGNARFVSNVKAQRDLQQQVLETSTGQFPFAVVLSCIDSRVPAELVFDQGIGDLFSVRVAGNVINEDVLGSMEYACKVAGSKIVVVMGHTKCGAVTSACNHVELGNITALLSKIQPAVNSIKPAGDSMIADEIEIVGVNNVIHSIERIRIESPILKELEANGEIEIVGAVYSVEDGKVTFLD